MDTMACSDRHSDGSRTQYSNTFVKKIQTIVDLVKFSLRWPFLIDVLGRSLSCQCFLAVLGKGIAALSDTTEEVSRFISPLINLDLAYSGKKTLSTLWIFIDDILLYFPEAQNALSLRGLKLPNGNIITICHSSVLQKSLLLNMCQ